MGRRCSRSGCSGVAVATLTFDYHESTAVLGRLAPDAEPGAYDLCVNHAKTTTAPRGWELVVLTEIAATPPTFGTDDLLALANAVREVGFADEPPAQMAGERDSGDVNTVVELSRRRHLRVIADAGR